MSTPWSAGRSRSTPAEVPETIVLDACLIINLYATRRFEEILSELPYRFAVSDKVFVDEMLYVRRGGSGEDALEHDPIDFESAISSEAFSKVPGSVGNR